MTPLQIAAGNAKPKSQLGGKEPSKLGATRRIHNTLCPLIVYDLPPVSSQTNGRVGGDVQDDRKRHFPLSSPHLPSLKWGESII
jgi:hypothetical protein